MSCYNPMERALKSIGNVSPTLLSIKNSILLTEQSNVRSVDSLIPGKSYAELLGFYGEAMGFLSSKAKPAGFAIGSPGASHLVCASDQIKASWVNATTTIIGNRFAKSSI